MTSNSNLPGVRDDEPRKTIQEGGLPRTARSDDGELLATPYSEVDVPEDNCSAESDREAACLRDELTQPAGHTP